MSHRCQYLLQQYSITCVHIYTHRIIFFFNISWHPFFLLLALHFTGNEKDRYLAFWDSCTWLFLYFMCKQTSLWLCIPSWAGMQGIGSTHTQKTTIYSTLLLQIGWRTWRSRNWGNLWLTEVVSPFVYSPSPLLTLEFPTPFFIPNWIKLGSGTSL